MKAAFYEWIPGGVVVLGVSAAFSAYADYDLSLLEVVRAESSEYLFVFAPVAYAALVAICGHCSSNTRLCIGLLGGLAASPVAPIYMRTLTIQLPLVRELSKDEARALGDLASNPVILSHSLLTLRPVIRCAPGAHAATVERYLSEHNLLRRNDGL
jgi:hypothetical protein